MQKPWFVVTPTEHSRRRLVRILTHTSKMSFFFFKLSFAFCGIWRYQSSCVAIIKQYIFQPKCQWPSSIWVCWRVYFRVGQYVIERARCDFCIGTRYAFQYCTETNFMIKGSFCVHVSFWNHALLEKRHRSILLLVTRVILAKLCLLYLCCVSFTWENLIYGTNVGHKKPLCSLKRYWV